MRYFLWRLGFLEAHTKYVGITKNDCYKFSMRFGKGKKTLYYCDGCAWYRLGDIQPVVNRLAMELASALKRQRLLELGDEIMVESFKGLD